MDLGLSAMTMSSETLFDNCCFFKTIVLVTSVVEQAGDTPGDEAVKSITDAGDPLPWQIQGAPG